MRLGAGCLLLALVACAPVPEGRKLTSDTIRPGVTAGHDFEAITPPVDRVVKYRIETPLRREGSEMELTIRRATGGRLERAETIRIPAKSVADARVIAAMVRQRNGRGAEVTGTDVILRATARIDRRGRASVTENGIGRITYTPHDCHATLGLCQMTRTGIDGLKEFLTVRTTESGGIWNEEIRYDPARDPKGRSDVVRESVYSVDKFAMLIDANQIRHDRAVGKYQEIRRVE